MVQRLLRSIGESDVTAVLLWLAAIIAEPQSPVADVDLAIVNRVVSVTIGEPDRWGRPRYSYSEQWWCSWWDISYVPLPWVGSTPVVAIDRGWIAMADLKRLTRCGDGWIFETVGYSVVTRTVLLIDSDFDVEMRWRKVYCPIRKP